MRLGTHVSPDMDGEGVGTKQAVSPLEAPIVASAQLVNGEDTRVLGDQDLSEQRLSNGGDEIDANIHYDPNDPGATLTGSNSWSPIKMLKRVLGTSKADDTEQCLINVQCSTELWSYWEGRCEYFVEADPVGGRERFRLGKMVARAAVKVAPLAFATLAVLAGNAKFQETFPSDNAPAPRAAAAPENTALEPENTSTKPLQSTLHRNRWVGSASSNLDDVLMNVQERLELDDEDQSWEVIRSALTHQLRLAKASPSYIPHVYEVWVPGEPLPNRSAVSLKPIFVRDKNGPTREPEVVADVIIKDFLNRQTSFLNGAL